MRASKAARDARGPESSPASQSAQVGVAVDPKARNAKQDKSPAPATGSAPGQLSDGIFKWRKGQRNFIKGVFQRRITAFVARRQYGKTTISSGICLLKMMKKAGHTVIFASLKLDLGREIVRKESEALQRSIAKLTEQAREAQKQLDVVDNAKGRSVLELSADDFAELYEAQRLEMRLYHSRSIYSRTKVVAATEAAVGETGDVILDEVGRMKNYRGIVEAMLPIASSNPEFRVIETTTPPPDDSHYSYERLAPPVGTQFPVNPEGNWYRTDSGVWVLRLDAYDAFADGVPLYDSDTGKAISPDEARAAEADKDAWDRNYLVKFTIGGTAAVGLLQLNTAQERGVGQCVCVYVQEEADFEKGLRFLMEKLGDGAVGIGVDLATTEKGTSNPTAVTVMERRGVEVIARATFVWKTADPAIAEDRLVRIVETVNQRKSGGRARRMAVDATNERYFATRLQTVLRGRVPVELVIQSETIEVPGKEPILKKAFLGAQLVAAIDDNQMTLAPERYIKTDLRLVKRDRGTYVAELGANGEHGDTFDSHKLALNAVVKTGAFEYSAVEVERRDDWGHQSERGGGRVRQKEGILC